MTDTAHPSTPTTTSPRAPLHAAATVVAGLTCVVLGTTAAIAPAETGSAWLFTGALMALLFTVGIVGMRRVIDRPPTARLALAVAAGAMAAFALAHFYAAATADDTALIFFSIFMVLSAAGLIVAGAAATRARTGTPLQRAALLLTGIWPIATVPAGAALGDVPHFVAIALWGACWIVFGLSLAIRSTSPTSYR